MGLDLTSVLQNLIVILVCVAAIAFHLKRYYRLESDFSAAKAALQFEKERADRAEREIARINDLLDRVVASAGAGQKSNTSVKERNS